MKSLFLVSFFSMALLPQTLWAWARQAHSIVGMLAAELIAKETKTEAFRVHAYDIGYYSNTPDLIWKALPGIIEIEGPQHHLDFDTFDQTVKEKNWNPVRTEFFKLHPEIPLKAGRALWRIAEIDQKLEDITKELRRDDYAKEQHRKLQAEWLTTAGILGHYYGDLAQPLHCTLNYDGQLSGQKGIHNFFEQDVVNAFFPTITSSVAKQVASRWPAFKKEHGRKSAFELAYDLARNSQSQVKLILDLDKKKGRDLRNAPPAEYQTLLEERLTQGVLYYALNLTRRVGWRFDDQHFYIFYGMPAYIPPVPL